MLQQRTASDRFGRRYTTESTLSSVNACEPFDGPKPLSPELLSVLESSQPHKIVSRPKRNFNLSPSYSAHKSPRRDSGTNTLASLQLHRYTLTSSLTQVSTPEDDTSPRSTTDDNDDCRGVLVPELSTVSLAALGSFRFHSAQLHIPA